MSEEKGQSKIKLCPQKVEDEAKNELEENLEDLIKEKDLLNGNYFYNYRGYWIVDTLLKGVVSSMKNFVVRDDDIILSSCPKSGTTWLKAITFLMVRRHDKGDSSLAYSQLIKENPHNIVSFLEGNDDLAQLQAPRLINTHIPYDLLSPSIITSGCKIVYISRNPMDQFISCWYFVARLKDKDREPCRLEDCFDMYCRSVHAYGPFWDHILGFWKASLERPQKILFLKFEDLKINLLMNIKRLAEFLGFPFSEHEEKNGTIEKISDFCSFEKIKNLEVNKNGSRVNGIPPNSFFRKGKIGDSKNFLTPTMMERMVNLMKEKYSEHYQSLKSSF